MIKKLTDLTAEQLDEIVKIWLVTNISSHNFIPKEYWKENVDYVKEELPKADVYVYLDDESIRGFIGLQENYIAGIFILEKYQNFGIGSQLLEVAKQNLTTMVLSVYEKNEKATQFYLNHGFRIVNQSLDGDTNEVELIMKWNVV
ncbi:GNAT family N-acetyltransferase [Vagococcus vulneris]|uniref:GNAT family N-acetyltransferase n=1 Tax=Vagococcus vulneris TaxID=1977869 RepID=A0A430A105_9ENTE|nr:GNAT family N-acetyltransferase [Vagococcus vulneris]RSU00078.1 GNAT family N-acetyltransferase [Vagococcus vulneris]